MRQNPAVPRRAPRRSSGARALARIAPLCAALALLCAAPAAAHAAVGEAALYGTPSAEELGADALGGDGDVWVIAGHSGETATIDRFAGDGSPQGAVEVKIPSGDRPVSIAPAAGQAMWLALEGSAPEIGQVEAGGTELKDAELLPAGNELAQAVTDGAGDLLVAETGGEPEVALAKPGEPLKPLALLPGAEPVALAAGAEGGVWVADAAQPGVKLIDAKGEEVIDKPLAEAPDSIAVGSEGAAWFSRDGTEPAIEQIPLAGEAAIYRLEEPEDAPGAVVSAPDGNIWFALADGLTPAIGRITAGGAVTRFEAGLGGVQSYGPTIAVGADRRLWLGAQTAAGWEMAAVTVLEAAAGEPEAPAPPSAGGQLSVGPAVVFSAAHATCSGLTWSEGTPTTQWLLDGSPIAGATATTYTPPRSEDGHSLSCRQTDTAADGLTSVRTSAGALVHEQPPAPSWPIGPAAQHCASPVCMQDGTGMGATVQSYREGSAWWASRQVRCVSAPWTSLAGDSSQPAIRALAEARTVTVTLQRMTPSGPLTVVSQTIEDLAAARDGLDGSGASPFAGTIALPYGARDLLAGELWSSRYPAALGRSDWLAPGGGLALYDLAAAGVARSFQLIYTLTAADRGQRLRCLVAASDGPAAAPTSAGYTSREYAVSDSPACAPRRLAVGGPQPTLLLDGNAACLSAPAGPPAPAPGLRALAVASGRLAVSLVCAVHGGCDGRLALLGAHGTLAQSGSLRVRPGTSRLIALSLDGSARRQLRAAGREGLPVSIRLGTAGTLAGARLIAVPAR